VSHNDKDKKALAPPTAGRPEARAPRKGALAASLGLHAGVLLALVLIALSGVTKPPEAPPVRVMLATEGPGAAGALGGNDGGGGAAEASGAPPAAASSETAEAPASAAPGAETPEELAEAPAAALEPSAAPVPQAATPEPPAAPLPTPPRRKPARPQPAPAETASPPTSAPEELAAAAPLAPGAPGSGEGPGGAAGLGTGAEGAGHGAIGNGPIEGPGDDYLERLRRWLNKYKRYPDQAKKDKQQGQLIVSFTILRDGTVTNPRIERSSGFPLLDDAALGMLRDASPVPPLPPSYRAASATIDLPVEFELGFFVRNF